MSTSPHRTPKSILKGKRIIPSFTTTSPPKSAKITKNTTSFVSPGHAPTLSNDTGFGSVNHNCKISEPAYIIDHETGKQVVASYDQLKNSADKLHRLFTESERACKFIEGENKQMHARHLKERVLWNNKFENLTADNAKLMNQIAYLKNDLEMFS